MSIPAHGEAGDDCVNQLAIPFSSTSRHLEAVKTVYIWKEPDQGGEKFVGGVTKRLTALGYSGVVRILQHDVYKDPSEVDCADV